jgi:hypothetical protein
MAQRELLLTAISFESCSSHHAYLTSSGPTHLPHRAREACARGGLCVPGPCVVRWQADQGTGRRCWLRRLPLVVKTPPHVSRTEQVRQMSR